MVENIDFLTQNNIIKYGAYWELSIGMCQSSSANEECDESYGV